MRPCSDPASSSWRSRLGRAPLRCGNAEVRELRNREAEMRAGLGRLGLGMVGVGWVVLSPVTAKGAKRMKERRRQRRAWWRWGLGMAMALGLGAGAGRNLASAQVNTEPTFVLSGVVIDARGSARALLEEPQLTGGRAVMLRVGDMIGPYRVVSIAPDHAVLERPGTSVVRIPLSGTPGSSTITLAPDRAAPAEAPTQQRPGPPLSEEQVQALASPPGPGEPRYRPAWEGASTPGPRPPAFDPEDFKRQVQRHIMGDPSR